MPGSPPRPRAESDQGARWRWRSRRRPRRRRPVARGILSVLTVAAICPLATLAQEPTRVVTAAASDYRVSGFGRWLRGEGYRELWRLPIEVPVLDLDAEDDGLTPGFTIGDGRGLALSGADGRAYTFRVIDKDLALELPESWHDTLPAKLVQDQTVADHPASSIIVPHLAAAAGILHTLRRLVVMPESEGLGEFEAEFAGQLGTIEEYPTARSDTHAGFHGATEIIDTATLWKRVLAGDGRPDAVALLRARLLDLLIGDWDRHYDQFRWARIPGHEQWQPIPEDRDHAFSNYEGFGLAIARTRWPRMVRFRDRIDQLQGLNAKGFEVDSWVLSELTREDYADTAEAMVAALPDEVIAAAVRAMPVEYHALNAEALTRRLQNRRDDLVRAAGAFYEDLAPEVDVYGTDTADVVTIDHDAAGALVRITTEAGDVRFERTFRASETHRVRVHLRGGEDSAVVRGRSGVAVAVIAGPGADSVDAGDGRVRVYDVEPGDIVRGSRTRVQRLADNTRIPVDAVPWQMPRDRDTHRYPIASVALEPDSSLFLGAGMVWTRYGLRTYPFAARHRAMLGLAFGRGTPRFAYEGTFRRPQSRLFYGLDFQVNGLARLNYHGFGNETPRDEDPDDFFEANAGEVRLGGTVNVESGPNQTWSFGAQISRFSNSDDDTLLALERPYGFGRFWDTGLQAAWRLDTRRRAQPAEQPGQQDWRLRSLDFGTPYTGVALQARGEAYPPLLDVDSWFGAVDGFATAYVPLAHRLTGAVRVGGRHVWGRFPWQAAAFLGGDTSVRGYRPQRFAGRSALYANVELRYALRRAVILVPGELGVFVFGDVGRVWADDETSDLWHPATGGGLFFVVPELETAFHLGVAAGRESPLVHLGFGFAF